MSKVQLHPPSTRHLRVMRSGSRILQNPGVPRPVEQTAWWRKTEKNRAGNLLAGARLKHRLTQTELARRSGVPQGHISAMENGRLKVSLAAAEKLGRALGEDLAERLFGEKGLQAKPRVRKG